MITYTATPPIDGCGFDQLAVHDGYRLHLRFVSLEEAGVEESEYEPLARIETEGSLVSLSIEIPKSMWLFWEEVEDEDAISEE